MKKADSPPKILQILFILSENKIGTCRTHLSGYFLQSVQSPKIMHDAQKYAAHRILLLSRGTRTFTTTSARQEQTCLAVPVCFARAPDRRSERHLPDCFALHAVLVVRDLVHPPFGIAQVRCRTPGLTDTNRLLMPEYVSMRA
jgi:hypothetical protein